MKDKYSDFFKKNKTKNKIITLEYFHWGKNILLCQTFSDLLNAQFFH